MEWLIYFIGVLDGFNALLIVLAIIGTIASIIFVAVCVTMYMDLDFFDIDNRYKRNYSDDEIKEPRQEKSDWITWKMMFNRTKQLIVVTLIISIISIFVPSSKTVIAMYVIPKIVRNENVQKLPDNILKYLNVWLEEQTEELEKKK